MNRELDGLYVKIKRGSEWEEVCFTDLTTEERLGIMKNKDKDWLISLCEILVYVIKDMGDRYDIYGREE